MRVSADDLVLRNALLYSVTTIFNRLLLDQQWLQFILMNLVELLALKVSAFARRILSIVSINIKASAVGAISL